MLKEIIIENNEETPVRYLKKLDAFKNGTVFKFYPGINIIVGKNGSGKTSLMRLIYAYTLTESSIQPEVPSVNDAAICGFLDSLFTMNTSSDKKFSYEDVLLDGAKVIMDYRGSVFRFIPPSERDKDDAMKSMINFAEFFASGRMSSGEQVQLGLKSLMRQMFSETTDIQFPIQELKDLRGSVNEIWERKIDLMLDYYRKNNIPKSELTQENYEFTVLMDEPDKNLDIDNIREVYKILSKRKEQTQLVVVIHNPILIYRLSKLKDVHFIEMTPDYINEVRDFVEGKDI